jgi:hypothetical protein
VRRDRSEAKFPEDGVRNDIGRKASEEMLASRPKCFSDETSSLNWETSSCDAWWAVSWRPGIVSGEVELLTRYARLHFGAWKISHLEEEKKTEKDSGR